MLEFFDTNDKKGVATIYDRHILFNSKLIKYFSNAYKVRVGIDKDDKKIYVFMLNKDYVLSGEINETSLLPLSVSKSYVRIASKDLIKFITESFKLDVNKEKSIQFDAIYDDSKKAIIIDMEGR
ncbi:MAG: hypothetical protein IJS83_02150 [Acholeplasmatales bacterium]|jgi:hypothetical protein|nr:hypothetical protein [Acholeplasmatales bacterium]